MSAQQGGATIDEIAKAFGLKKASAISWVCRWENYYNQFRDIVQHFISKNPDNPRLYKSGPDWWGERFNRGMGEDWKDAHDVDGINPLHVSLGFIKTRTDSITGKRTLKGTRRTGAYLAWLKNTNGTTTAAFARKFDLNMNCASVTLSRFKKAGELEIVDKMWKPTNSAGNTGEVVKQVVNEYREDGRVVQKEKWTVVNDTTKENDE
ncbi:MAG: hypothetical protein PHU23_17935 [Dehalococcoidales bacterium]|nr:hypothetical protein [Dehalococcoidales bacterium]